MNPRTPRWVVSGEKVRKARIRRGITLEVAGNLSGRSRSWLHRLETGQTYGCNATVDDLVALSVTLNTPAADLMANPHDAAVLADLVPRPATDGLALGWTGAGSLEVLQAIANGDDMQRRGFLTVAGAAAVAPATRWAGAPTPTDVGRGSGNSLHEGVVDEVDRMTMTLDDMSARVGVAVTPWAQDHLRRVTSMLRERSYSETVGRGLRRSAGDLLRLCGYLAFDSGDHGRAQRYYNGALRVSHAAGDRAGAAGAIQQLAWQAEELGQRREALEFAQAARAGYRGGSARLQALLAFSEARSRAALRDVAGSRRAIDAATAAYRSAGSPESDLWWIRWVTESTAHRQAAKAYAALGDWSQVVESLHRAETGRQDRSGRRRAHQHLRLATAYACHPSPDVERSVATGTLALEALSGPVESPRALSFATDLVGHLAPYRRQPEVREFTTRVRELVKAS